MSIQEEKKLKMLGFRSNKLWKKIISVVYLCVCGLFLIAGICVERLGQITTTDYVLDKVMYVLLVAWLLTPYIFLSDTIIRKKTPLFKQYKTNKTIVGTLIISALIIVALSLIYMLHSDAYKNDMQNHAYVVKSRIAATCDAKGKNKYICTYCGKEKEDIVDAHGHRMRELSRIEPSELEDGEVVKKCEFCAKKEVFVIKNESCSTHNTTISTVSSSITTTLSAMNTSPTVTSTNPPSTENKITNSTTKNEINDVIENTEDYITEERPLTLIFDKSEYDIGDCTIILKKIEIVNTPFKSAPGFESTYAKHIRIHATVKNISSHETYFTSRKDGSFFIGKYYGADKDTNIGWNNNYKWKVDANVKCDFGWTLKPNETRDICVSGVFVDRDRLKYSDEPQLELYFINDGSMLTISIN